MLASARNALLAEAREFAGLGLVPPSDGRYNTLYRLYLLTFLP